MKEFRSAIIRMHEFGVEKREIDRLLGIHEAIVRKAIKRFEETESNEDRPGRGRKKTARSVQHARRMSNVEASIEEGME